MNWSKRSDQDKKKYDVRILTEVQITTHRPNKVLYYVMMNFALAACFGEIVTSALCIHALQSVRAERLANLLYNHLTLHRNRFMFK